MSQNFLGQFSIQAAAGSLGDQEDAASRILSAILQDSDGYGGSSSRFSTSDSITSMRKGANPVRADAEDFTLPDHLEKVRLEYDRMEGKGRRGAGKGHLPLIRQVSPREAKRISLLPPASETELLDKVKYCKSQHRQLTW
jgi:hypothetical protein